MAAPTAASSPTSARRTFDLPSMPICVQFTCNFRQQTQSVTLSPMSLVVATEITAIATAALAFFAIITTGFAYFAFRAQSTQVSILKCQEEQATEHRRRGQAARLYLTELASPAQAAIPDSVQMPGGRVARGPSVTVTAHNTSEQPVYDLGIHWVDWATTAQAGAADQLGTLGPGDNAESERELPGNVIIGRFHAVAYFRDAAGLRWTLTTDGQLKPVPPSLLAGASLIGTGAAASGEPSRDSATTRKIRRRIRRQGQSRSGRQAG